MTCSSFLRSHCLSPEEEARRLELYNQGLSDYEIASFASCSAEGIASWRRRRGLSAHRKHKEYDQRLELYHQGLSDAEIASIVGCEQRTICNWRKCHGLLPHQRKRKHRQYNNTVKVHMSQVLTAEQCAEMRLFLGTLVALSRSLPPGQKPDVGRFMMRWRQLRVASNKKSKERSA